MGYRLEAVIGSAAVLSAITSGQPAMVVVPLRQGLGLVPMTDEAFDAVNDGSAADGSAAGLAGFRKLPGGFDGLRGSAWSHPSHALTLHTFRDAGG